MSHPKEESDERDLAMSGGERHAEGQIATAIVRWSVDSDGTERLVFSGLPARIRRRLPSLHAHVSPVAEVVSEGWVSTTEWHNEEFIRDQFSVVFTRRPEVK